MKVVALIAITLLVFTVACEQISTQAEKTKGLLPKDSAIQERCPLDIPETVTLESRDHPTPKPDGTVEIEHWQWPSFTGWKNHDFSSDRLEDYWCSDGYKVGENVNYVYCRPAVLSRQQTDPSGVVQPVERVKVSLVLSAVGKASVSREMLFYTYWQNFSVVEYSCNLVK